MVGNYGVTEDDARNYPGVDDQEIGDAPVQTFIEQAEKEAERITNTVFRPVERIDRVDGNRSRVLFVDKSPVLRVKDIQINGEGDNTAPTSIDPEHVIVNPVSGKLVLKKNADEDIWDSTGFKRNVVRYEYGKLSEDDSVKTTTDATVTAGDGATISVSDAADFSADDYVKLIDMEGREEIVTLSAVDTNNDNLTADVQYDHSSGAMVVKMVTPDEAKELIKVLTAIRIAAFMIGGTKDFQSSYDLGDLHVSKGEPYPPFKQLLPEFKRERDRLVKILKQPTIRA